MNNTTATTTAQAQNIDAQTQTEKAAKIVTEFINTGKQITIDAINPNQDNQRLKIEIPFELIRKEDFKVAHITYTAFEKLEKSEIAIDQLAIDEEDKAIILPFQVYLNSLAKVTTAKVSKAVKEEREKMTAQKLQEIETLKQGLLALGHSEQEIDKIIADSFSKN